MSHVAPFEGQGGLTRQMHFRERRVGRILRNSFRGLLVQIDRQDFRVIRGVQRQVECGVAQECPELKNPAGVHDARRRNNQRHLQHADSATSAAMRKRDARDPLGRRCVDQGEDLVRTNVADHGGDILLAAIYFGDDDN